MRWGRVWPSAGRGQPYTNNQNLGSGNTQSAVKEINKGAWADINGDGRLDLVIAYKTPGGSTVRKTYLKTDTGWNGNGLALPEPLRSYENSVTNMYTGFFKSPVINQGQQHTTALLPFGWCSSGRCHRDT